VDAERADREVDPSKPISRPERRPDLSPHVGPSRRPAGPKRARLDNRLLDGATSVYVASRDPRQRARSFAPGWRLDRQAEIMFDQSDGDLDAAVRSLYSVWARRLAS
jgi:hypothetical protein